MDRDLVDRIAQAVQSRLGGDDPKIGRVIAEELAAVLDRSSLFPPQPDARPEDANRSRVVITSHGRNGSGIVARLAAAIDEFDGDIRDLSQTIVGDYFTMLFVVDVRDAPNDGARFSRLRERLKQVAGDLGVHVVVMHDDILSAMHSI